MLLLLWRVLLKRVLLLLLLGIRVRLLLLLRIWVLLLLLLRGLLILLLRGLLIRILLLLRLLGVRLVLLMRRRVLLLLRGVRMLLLLLSVVLVLRLLLLLLGFKKMREKVLRLGRDRGQVAEVALRDARLDSSRVRSRPKVLARKEVKAVFVVVVVVLQVDVECLCVEWALGVVACRWPQKHRSTPLPKPFTKNSQASMFRSVPVGHVRPVDARRLKVAKVDAKHARHAFSRTPHVNEEERKTCLGKGGEKREKGVESFTHYHPFPSSFSPSFARCGRFPRFSLPLFRVDSWWRHIPPPRVDRFPKKDVRPSAPS